jgi:hypothetical protein
MMEHEIGLLNIHDDSSEDEKLVKAKRRNKLKEQNNAEFKSDVC